MKKIFTYLFIFIYLLVFDTKAQLIPEGIFAGKVYYDVNGSADGLVNGLALPFEINMFLNGQMGGTFESVDLAQTTINGGEFHFSTIAGTYNLSVDLTSIPSGWQLTSPPSILFSDNELGWSTGSLTNYFGISKIPDIPLNGEDEFMNPNGASELNIPLGTFASTDDGVIQKIIIFGGTGYESITINGIVYTASNPIPLTGIEVITENAGGRLLPGTVTINPISEGATTATINYKVVDNANLTSNLGTITLNISTPFISLCSPISSTNSLGLSLQIPSLPLPTSEFPSGLPLLHVNSQFDPILLGVSRDQGTAFFMGTTFGGIQNPYFRYFMVYRQNSVWRFSTLNTASVFNTFNNYYQCTSGFNDVFPPCDAIWEAVTDQTYTCNQPNCISNPNWPTGLSTSVSSTIINVNIQQPCTFQQNNTTMVGGLPKYLWSDPTNWSCGALPTATTTTYIPSGTTVTLGANINSSSILNLGIINLNGFSILP